MLRVKQAREEWVDTILDTIRSDTSMSASKVGWRKNRIANILHQMLRILRNLLGLGRNYQCK